MAMLMPFPWKKVILYNYYCIWHCTFLCFHICSFYQRCVRIFHCYLESLRGMVCSGEALRWDFSRTLVKKACWLASSYSQMDGVSRESHTHWSEAPLPFHSGRKWDWTRGGRARKGVNHRTNAALHHRFLSPPAHPLYCARLSTQRPLLLVLSMSIINGTICLHFLLNGWHLVKVQSKKHAINWKLLIVSGDSCGHW